MANENPDNLPVGNQSFGARDDRSRALYYFEHLHYHPNDLTELRMIAETNPELASEIVQSNREANRLSDGSYRLGLIVASLLALALVGGGITVALVAGWWQTIVFAGAILAVSHVLTVILTGEWSDTSWFARILGVNKDKGSSEDQ